MLLLILLLATSSASVCARANANTNANAGVNDPPSDNAGASANDMVGLVLLKLVVATGT